MGRRALISLDGSHHGAGSLHDVAPGRIAPWRRVRAADASKLDIAVRHMSVMKKKFAYRSWFYFRQGWALYFAFIFAAINTLTVTYYLAIENLPFLHDVFTSFGLYVLTAVSAAIPLLTIVGYLHYRRSRAYASEVEVGIEQNPYFYKIPPGFNKEVQWPLFLKFSEILVKLANNEKLSDKDLEEIKALQEKISRLIDGESIGVSKRTDFDS